MQGWWAVSYVVLWGLVILLGVLVVALARQIGTLHLRLGPRGALEVDIEGPSLGEVPPPAEVTDLDGRPFVIGGPGRAQLVFFTSPSCPLCEEVLPSLAVAAKAAGLAAHVVTSAPPDDAYAAYAPRKLGAPVTSAAEVTAAYGIPGTPFLVVLDDTGAVRGKGTINNLEQMEGLIDTARRRMTTEAVAGKVS